MKQKAFTPIFAENLRSNVSENIAKYNNSDYLWENEAKDADAIIELDFEQPDLSSMIQFAESKRAVDDFQAAKILYESYHQHLTPLKAAQQHFWQYLSHVVLKDYMRTRWPKINDPDCDAGYINEHWFYAQGPMRNWLEGMFWSVNNTVIENEDGTLDYKYTELLFSIQKIRDRGIAAAPYVINNRAVVVGMLKFYMDELEKNERGEDSVFDKYFEYRTDKCQQLVFLI